MYVQRIKKGNGSKSSKSALIKKCALIRSNKANSGTDKESI